MPELKPRKTLFNPELKRRGIYLLPSLFTTAALFFGFFAIVQAIQGHFETAATAIFIAMIMDGLDGRVARLTHTQSAFGAEYDSLSDMVCFGVAPALVIYEWALLGIGRPGWAAAFIYCASAALRLARFNTTLSVMDKRYFQGLPSPAAAALVVGLVWAMISQNVSSANMRWPAAFVTVFAGLSMVSNVRFYSFKDINLKKSVPFVAVLVMMLVFALISSPFTAEIIFALFCVYALSGYALALSRLLRKKTPTTENPPPPA